MLSSKRRASSYTISLKIKCAVAALVCASAVCVFAIAPVYAVRADGAAEYAMELNTGKVLHAKNSESRMPMASTTKIMTALIIIEECDFGEVITVPDEAVGVEGSSIYLKHGEKISICDLVFGLMLRSGNDSAVALAVHHSGSIAAFADRMNERAEEMGLKNTHFANPSGLPDNEHYTTASDLCVLACNAMKNVTFRRIVSARAHEGKFRSFINKNKILSKLDGANGIKTGYTQEAGRCLVSSAERDGMDVVCVVLNCPDMYERSMCIIDGAFAEYELKTIGRDKIFMCGATPCALDDERTFLLPRNKEFLVIVIPKTNCKTANEYCAELQIYCENNLIFSANLYSIDTER